MASNKFVSERVFLKNVRVSYPALDEPKSFAGGEPKFECTFLMEENSDNAKNVAATVKKVATDYFGDKARSVMVGNAVPLHKGSDKNPIPDGYEGSLYIRAKSKNRPKLVGAKPTQTYTEALEIREVFRPGNFVNAYITLYAYDKGSRGVAAMLEAIQFRAVGDPLTGSANFDFPDESGTGSQSATGMDFADEEDTPF